MSAIKRARVITKPSEVRAKIVPSDYNNTGKKRITIYLGKEIYNKFFTKKERENITRVKLDLTKDGNLILRKVLDYREGTKLCIQGLGTFGTHKVLTTLPAGFDASTLPSWNHALNFNFVDDFGLKSLELIPPVKNNKNNKNNKNSEPKNKRMIINKKSLAPKEYEIRLKVNTYNKTFRLYFTKLLYDRFIVRGNDIGRVEFEFPIDLSVKYFFLKRVSGITGRGKPIGHKIIKNSHSNSYTVMGKIPEYFDASFINPVNHIVNYDIAVKDSGIIKIYPQLDQNKFVSNNTGKSNYNKSDELLRIYQQDKKGVIFVKDGKGNLIPITAPTNDINLTKKQIEEYNFMTTSNKNQEARISELEKNQEEILGGLIEKFNNTTQEVLKSVLENELADIRSLIEAKNNDADEKLIAKANDMFQGILDNIMQKELDSIREQIKGNEKDIKEILKELIIINREKAESKSWFARLFTTK